MPETTPTPNLMTWHIVTAEQFAAGTPIDSDLYFISDQKLIYRGANLFTRAIEFYTGELPTNPAPYRLYVDTATFAGKMFDGSDWQDVIKPLTVDSTVTADGANAVTGAAVASYVDSKIQEITGTSPVVSLTGATWDAAEHILSFTKSDGSAAINIVLSGVGVSLNYNNATGVLRLLDASGNDAGEPINLALDRFIKSGEYDAENKKIMLYFDDAKTDKIEIPVADLVDTYTAESSSSVDLTIVANKIKATVKLSATEGNAATMMEDGIYVPTVDVSGKVDKVSGATAGNIATLTADGSAADSGKSLADMVPVSALQWKTTM